MSLAIASCHGLETERLDPLSCDRCADQPASVGCHEGDHFRSGPGGRSDQVGLVLASRVVSHDHEFTGGDVGHDFLDWAEGQCAHAMRGCWD